MLWLTVDKKITAEQIDNILETGNAQEIIKGAIISQDLDDTVQAIEERHIEIMKLERQVKEVYELFQDLAALIDMQQETLDVVEDRILKAKGYAEKGVGNLRKAEDHQKTARKVQLNFCSFSYYDFI